VDLRKIFVPVRDQGTRPLCLVFAASDLNAFIHQLADPLSVEYLAYHAYQLAGHNNYSQGLGCDAVLAALELKGQPVESALPYDLNAYAPRDLASPTSTFFKANGAQFPAVINEIKNSLDKGIALVLGVILTDDFFLPKSPYVFDETSGAAGRHALLAVGYGKFENGEIAILVRNSWGNSWADLGYAWLSEKFVNSRAEILITLGK
jgi:C1A family cysteine protease